MKKDDTEEQTLAKIQGADNRFCSLLPKNPKPGYYYYDTEGYCVNWKGIRIGTEYLRGPTEEITLNYNPVYEEWGKDPK